MAGQPAAEELETALNFCFTSVFRSRRQYHSLKILYSIVKYNVVQCDPMIPHLATSMKDLIALIVVL